RDFGEIRTGVGPQNWNSCGFRGPHHGDRSPFSLTDQTTRSGPPTPELLELALVEVADRPVGLAGAVGEPEALVQRAGGDLVLLGVEVVQEAPDRLRVADSSPPHVRAHGAAVSRTCPRKHSPSTAWSCASRHSAIRALRRSS